MFIEYISRLGSIKDRISDLICGIGEFILFIMEVFKVVVAKRPNWHLLRDQLYQVGVLSLPVVALTGLSTGLVLAAQSFYQLSDKGLTSVTGLMVAKSMIVELGPVLTAFMITGRIGASMCAEIGSMKVTEQIDALRSMSINPLRYLVAPRLIAGILMAPLLTIFSNCMGILGAYGISIYHFGMTPANFYDPIINQLTHFDYFISMSKALLFGLLIVSICCYKGMSTKGGAAGVGRITTNSVVICYTVILFSNFLLTITLNLIRITLNLRNI
ncbi:MAG: transporter permease [Chlamydiales bacterium]|nr:transporter permease [Chlamydiales bacterium]